MAESYLSKITWGAVLKQGSKDGRDTVAVILGGNGHGLGRSAASESGEKWSDS